MTAAVIPIDRSYDDEDPDAEFWTQRPVLTHIHEFAQAARSGPWGTLGVILARAVAAVEPNVVLPPLVGSVASLNFFLAAVGESGLGKGAAEGAANGAIRFIDGAGKEIVPHLPNIGSGEGLAKQFCASSDDAPPVTRAIVSVAEIDTLASLAGRQGATLMPELRKAWVGESIGFNNASKSTTTAVAAQTYRLCLIVGVQPENGAALINDAKGGTPQRFVWLPVYDDYAPARKPDRPETLDVTVPSFTAGRVVVDIPESVQLEVDTWRLARLRREVKDPLDSHIMLCRLKVAAALMILDGRIAMTEEDWQLAGYVMKVSRRSRDGIEHELAERQRTANRARALLDGERAAISSDVTNTAIFERAVKSIRSRLKSEWSNRSELRRGMRPELRPSFDAAIEQLRENGEAESRESPRGTEYRLA